MKPTPNTESQTVTAMILGEVASAGLARGRALLCDCAKQSVVPSRQINETEVLTELARFDEAVMAVENTLREVQHRVSEALGKKEADIFEAQILMLRDTELRLAVREICTTQQINVEAAIEQAIKRLKPEHEAELKSAFARTLAVRTQSQEARELADQFFFETLVRVHRAGEGAPYTGLKPADTKVDPTVEAADHALDSGKIDALIKTVTEEAVAGIRQRFTEAVEKKKHAEHNVEAGREYVASYVEFVHYVEALHAVATRTASAHEHEEEATQPAKVIHEHH